MHHSLIDGIGGLVWEDAGGQAGYQLLDPELMGQCHYIVLHENIGPPKLHGEALCSKRRVWAVWRDNRQDSSRKPSKR